ncbi:MAG: arylsulfatase [Ilumatobacteraceae bacterium]
MPTTAGPTSDSVSTHPSGLPQTVVIVMADDMGFGDLEVLNPQSKIPTPHMNAVAATGVSFRDAHSASSVCTSSRYGFLTGRYCWRSALPFGVFAGYEAPLIEPDRPTIATVLRSAGYTTAAVGKWHLGFGYHTHDGLPVDDGAPLPRPTATRELEESIDFEGRLTGGPIELGFDTFFGTSGCPTCQPPYGWIDQDRFVDPPSVYETEFPYTGRPGMTSPGWAHDEADPIIVARAVDIIRTTPLDQPLFVYVGLDAPHEPCTDDVVPMIARGRSGAGPRGDLVWMVDHAVGEIVAALDETGRAPDTLLVVTSDNGALAGDRIMDDGHEVYRTYDHLSSGDWRGHKAHIWEGGHREPLLIRWPNRIPAGVESDALVCLTDLFATLAAVTGAVIPAGAGEDSVDISSVLFSPVLGGDTSSPRTSMIHHSQRGVFAVREGDWKVILGTDGSGGWPPPSGGGPVEGVDGQLYNLADDPTESRNLWHDRPDIIDRLSDLLTDTRADGRTAERPAATSGSDSIGQ